MWFSISYISIRRQLPPVVPAAVAGGTGSSRRWYRQLLPVVQNVAAAAPAGGIPRGAIIETAMTDEDIAFARLKASLLPAMRRNPGTGVRVTIESLVAAAELVKDDQAECIEVAGQLFIREPV